MSRIRHIDFYPDEFLSGVDGMSAEQVGIYWLVCSKIYSRGRSIPDDDRENARIFRIDQRTWKRVKAELIAQGKLRTDDGKLVNARCLTELVKANKRIDDARNGALQRWASAEESVDDSQMVAPTAREPLPNHSQT